MGNSEIIKFLIEKKADVNLLNKVHKYPILYADKLGNFEVVEQLIKLNAGDIEYVSETI